MALNRVIGQDPSQILGSLQANGQVFLVNPNGILFGQGAQVSTAGLLASTRDISSADFASGQYRFSGSSNGKVVNQGTLSAGQGGYVALIGAQVVNAGTIQAPAGDVRLAAADAVSVRINGAGLAGFTVERGALDGLVANYGLIQAAGGRVALTAAAADALAKAVVNQDGIIEAQAVASQNGTVELRADAQAGQVDISGRIDVSSATGTGGTATATAHAVNLTGTAAIDASGSAGGGMVLIGGGWQGQDTSIANASTVTMAPGAGIDVSARDNGNGGTAVLWSQDGTAFAGDIAARGGALGGSGGKVETSSHDVLQAIGSVNASAAAGAGGQWLLDPRNVTIAATGAGGTAYGGGSTYNGSSTFTPGADSVILASTIANTLNAGSSVTITTGSSGTSLGDINVNAAIVTNGVYSLANTLSLLAAHDININARIADTSSTYLNRLNVVLTPGAAGNVSFGSGGSITTLGGNVYIGSVSGTGYSEAVTRMGQNLTMAAGSYIDTAGGLIDAKVNGTITLAANSLRNSGGTAYYNSSPYLSTQAGTGGGRGGVAPDDEALLAIAREVRASKSLWLAGVLTHAGHSYHAAGLAAIRGIAEAERAGVVHAAARLRAAGFEVGTVSVGATPTAVCADRLDGVTEMRPGVYTFFDLDQAARGICCIQDIALSVLATVIGHNPRSRRVLIDAGALALSKDASGAEFRDGLGFGLVCHVEGTTPLAGLRVAELHQEHGLVACEGDGNAALHALFDALPIGSRVRILPHHACMTAAPYDRYHVVRGAGADVHAVWGKAQGWHAAVPAASHAAGPDA